MLKPLCYLPAILFIAIVSCSKKHEDKTPPYVPHYPSSDVYLDSMPDIQIPGNTDTIITLPINLRYNAYLPTIFEVSINTSAANITVSPASASASTDTLKPYTPLIFPFSLHINAVDTGVIQITTVASALTVKTSASHGASSSFKIIVH